MKEHNIEKNRKVCPLCLVSSKWDFSETIRNHEELTPDKALSLFITSIVERRPIALDEWLDSAYADQQKELHFLLDQHYFEVSHIEPIKILKVTMDRDNKAQIVYELMSLDQEYEEYKTFEVAELLLVTHLICNKKVWIINGIAKVVSPTEDPLAVMQIFQNLFLLPETESFLKSYEWTKIEEEELNEEQMDYSEEALLFCQENISDYNKLSSELQLKIKDIVTRAFEEGNFTILPLLKLELN